MTPTRCFSILNDPYDHAKSNQVLSVLNIAFTNSGIRSLSISNCSYPLEVPLQNCSDTLRSLTNSGARSGIGPHTRGLLIESTSLAELRLEFIRMSVMDLIDVLASKRFLRTVNIRTRCIFEQGLLAHQELRELLLERILDMFDGLLPVKTLTAEHVDNLRTVKISSNSFDWMISLLDRMPETVTNLHVALGCWNDIFEGVILSRSNILIHLTIDSEQRRGILVKLRFLRIIVVQSSHLQ
ncbi:hypothetical protein BGZ91_011216 [Linnemannia elongata]|nr:hypothetical protein BGZ91_011216 [Linnemannia elongata]